MDPSKSRVLTVQDFYLIRNIITYILRQNGFKAIDSVGSCREALSKLESGNYIMVVSDWNSNIDGLELLYTIRENPELKNIIFIMVTTEIDKNKIMQAMEQGVDGYVVKPFTAEALCLRIVSAIKSKYKDLYKSVQQSVRQSRATSTTDDTGPSTKVSETTPKAPFFSVSNWSTAPSYLRSNPKIFVAGNTGAMMDIISPQFDMMKETSDFVSINDMLLNAKNTARTAKKQTENASQIAAATGDIATALNLLDAPAGSPKSIQGLKAVNKTAAKLSDMIDTFNKDAEDVMKMLSGMEGMVRQAHIHEINESIKDSYELEMHPETGALKDSKIGPNSTKVAEKLAMIRNESENARGALTTAAENVAQVIAKLTSTDPSTSSSRELFHQLSSRIENIIDTLDSQIDKSGTLAQGMEEVATVKSEVSVVSPDKKEADTEVNKIINEEPGPRAGGETKSKSVPVALKKIIEYRILMIDLIKKDFHISIKNLEEMLNDKAEFRQEHLPGHPASSISKWLDKRIEQKDYYDIDVCHQIADAGNELYEQSAKALEMQAKGNRREALSMMKNINGKVNMIDTLLKKLKDELKKKI